MPSLQQPSLACDSCKTRKRKCDKRLPKCSLCASKDLACHYPRLLVQNREEISQGQQVTPAATPYPPISALASNGHVNSSEQTGDFKPVFYMDWNVYLQFYVDKPKPSLSIPLYVSKLIGNFSRWEAIASEFFNGIHTWMPIISKKRFYENVLSVPTSPIRAEYALLILCMDLLMWIPEGQNPRSLTYRAVKSYYLDLEIAGIVSIQVLQAGILISIYELGQAIYPSAAISIDACARYGRVLGINWDSPSAGKQLFSWVDAEEQSRVWWGVVMLDRILRIGYQRQPTVVDDPTENVLLPADDAAWDTGVMSPRRIGVNSSTAREDMGVFALAAEATRLLGQVLKHVSAVPSTGRHHEEQAMLLDRALRSLSNVVDFEGHNQRVSIMNQTAMCFTALLLLHEGHASKNTRTSVYFEKHHVANHITELVTRIFAEATEQQTPLRPLHACVKEGSPFLTTMLYQTACANLRLCEENYTKESWEAFDVIKTSMRSFSRRWTASRAYLEILEAKEMGLHGRVSG